MNICQAMENKNKIIIIFYSNLKTFCNKAQNKRKHTKNMNEFLTFNGSSIGAEKKNEGIFTVIFYITIYIFFRVQYVYNKYSRKERGYNNI